MMIPTVHLNGTSAKHLLSELEVAYAAVSAAKDALQQVTVHGRDYYPQGPHAYGQARTEMDARLASLDTVAQELLALHQAIQKQGDR